MLPHVNAKVQRLTKINTSDSFVAMMSAIRILLAASVLILAPPTAPAAQVTLTAVADTALWEREPNHNLGSSDLLIAGRTGSDGNARGRLLFKFELAGNLPVNAVIESASLYLRVVRAPSSMDNPAQLSQFTIRRILQAWGEGNKSYADPQTPMTSTVGATAGEATWSHRFFGDPTKRWITPGGDLNDGDFAEAPSGEISIGLGGDRDYTIALAGVGTTDLRDWLVYPEANFGWVLKTESELVNGTARIFASREHETLAYRPQLTITYSLLEQSAFAIIRNGATVEVSFDAKAGTVYAPQFRPALTAGGWASLPLLGPLTTDGRLSFTNSLTAATERYYRVIIP